MKKFLLGLIAFVISGSLAPAFAQSPDPTALFWVEQGSERPSYGDPTLTRFAWRTPIGSQTPLALGGLPGAETFHNGLTVNSYTGKVYYTTRNLLTAEYRIIERNVDGTAPRTLVSCPNPCTAFVYPMGLKFDYASGQIIMIDLRGVYKVDPAAASPSAIPLYTNASMEVIGGDIDSVNGDVVFFDHAAAKFKAVKLDGTNLRTLGAGCPQHSCSRGVAVDGTAGRIYYAKSVSGTMRVFSQKFDGTDNVEMYGPFNPAGQHGINDLAIDFSTRTLYISHGRESFGQGLSTAALYGDAAFLNLGAYNGALANTPTNLALGTLVATPPPPPLTANAGGDQTLSASLYGAAQFNQIGIASGGKEPYTYQWTVDGQSASASASLSVALGVGVHSAVLTVTDSKGAVASSSATIGVQLPTIGGATGPQGPAGPAGPAGPQGPKGDTGEKGDKGDKGDDGPMGPAGPVGPAGPQGPEGPQGAVGAPGTPGAPGAQGPAGPQGEQGQAGAQGPIGPMGPQGEPGPAGAQGPVGPIGPAGPQGEQGPAGAQGPAGPQGATGATGATGAQGPQGVPGATGATGAMGPMGVQGPAGPGVSFELRRIDTTTTIGMPASGKSVIYLVETDRRNVTLTLPPASAAAGRFLIIKRVDRGRAVLIRPSGNDTIEASRSALRMENARDSITFVTDGTEWVVLSLIE